MRYNLFGQTLFLFLLFSLFSFSFSHHVVSEKRILLDLKTRVSDSSGILSSWDLKSTNHCSWFGISCDSKSRVVSVNIRGCDANKGNHNPPSYYGSSKPSPFQFHGIGGACSRGNGKLLVGEISPLIGELTELRVLSLAFNDLKGEIPEKIWGLEKLEVLDLEGNGFTGKLPDRISGLRNLRVLNLGLNRISGEIPLSLSKCTGLEVLNLAGNELNGSVPGFFGNLGKLRRLDLSCNQLNGPILGSIGRNCRNLKRVDLSYPTEKIPLSLGGYWKLKKLLLFSNFLHSAIPRELGRRHRINVLNVSRNKFSGLLPAEALKLSKGSFSGHMPKTIFKLRKLMASGDGVEGSQSNKESNSAVETDQTPVNNGLYPIEIASIVSASVIVTVLIVLILLFIYTRKWKQTSRVQVTEPREIKVFVDIGVPLTYENIVRATRYFSNANCIGHGGFGSTYKAEIAPDTLLAVKRLSVGRFQGDQQFHAEIMTLEMVRHPNLVTLIGFHASETEMFLVYNYLPGGNLENFIKERSEKAVEWKVIHKIALDVAHALAYLHEQCSPKVLHRDVKPSNILLDNNFNAFLSDFGLSKLLGTSQTHATTGVQGTFGYVAPEYAMTCRVSEKADVYSYGIVLLELISDKKALDPSFSSHENGFNIVSWAHMMLSKGQAKDVFTQGLWRSGPHDDLVEILHLALKCTVDSLSTRPTMKQVVQQLKRIHP